MIVDSHAHLVDPKFADDVDLVVQRAIEAGVTRVIAVGDSLESSAASLRLAQRHPATLWATVGVHPHRTKQYRAETADALRQAAADPKCVAIGETGLDYYYSFSKPAQQLPAFEEQLDLARELNLPVVIHCRNAFDDLLAVLADHPPGAAGGVVHSFTGTADEARAILDFGLHLGINGIVAFAASRELREVIQGVPPGRVLLETDSPYLAPPPHRGVRNEPAFTIHVAECLAGLHGVSVEKIARVTTANAARLFRLPKDEPAASPSSPPAPAP